MEKDVVEKLIISKEDFKEYFGSRKIVSKEEYIKYINRTKTNVIKK